MLPPHGSALAPREVFEVSGFFSENAEEGFAPGFVAREGMFRVLGHAFNGESKEVDAVPRGEVELERVGLLEEFDSETEQVGLGEREVIFEDLHFIIAVGKAER